MRNIWFSSDPHYDHANILNFKDSDGKRFRGDLFSSVEEMNEVMIERHNSRVKTGDIWYCGGDVTFKPEKFSRIGCRLNGAKRLILGNHDNPKSLEVMKWFEKVMIWRLFKDEGFVATHIPILERNFRHKVKANLHGHEHQNPTSPPYFSMCVEHTNYYPLHMDEIVEMINRV